MKKVIESKKLPKVIGPYSPAVLINDLLFTSGQIAIDEKTLAVQGNTEEQTLHALTNIHLLLLEAGLTKSSILKLNVYVTDLKKFEDVNKAFQTFFEGHVFPARTTIEVSGLPLGAKVEIDCMASRK
tara:strand:+ start:621 stop:1001 length:381 start_codon:yes stop_codon:yes gene_type:complete